MVRQRVSRRQRGLSTTHRQDLPLLQLKGKKRLPAARCGVWCWWITIADSKQWSFFAFLVLFEIGSLICGAAPSSVILIVGRVVAGIGSAGIMSGGLTIVAGAVPLERRPGTCATPEYVFCKVVSLTSYTILQLLWVWSLVVSITHLPVPDVVVKANRLI